MKLSEPWVKSFDRKNEFCPYCFVPMGSEHHERCIWIIATHLEEENREFLADRDALIGYACVLESMLRQQDIKLPPKPSILTDTRVVAER